MKNTSHLPYILLDSGNCRKLEQAGAYRIVRPALNAFWKPTLPESEWSRIDAEFKRDSGGGGTWTWKNGRQPKDWTVSWGGINLYIKPTQFGHLGFFAEQATNWNWLRSCLKQMPPHAKTLNLFAYSGGATLAMSSSGADTCHLDASNGIIEWAKKNRALAENPGRIRRRYSRKERSAGMFRMKSSSAFSKEETECRAGGAARYFLRLLSRESRPLNSSMIRFCEGIRTVRLNHWKDSMKSSIAAGIFFAFSEARDFKLNCCFRSRGSASIFNTAAEVSAGRNSGG